MHGVALPCLAGLGNAWRGLAGRGVPVLGLALQGMAAQGKDFITKLGR